MTFALQSSHSPFHLTPLSLGRDQYNADKLAAQTNQSICQLLWCKYSHFGDFKLPSDIAHWTWTWEETHRVSCSWHQHSSGLQTTFPSQPPTWHPSVVIWSFLTGLCRFQHNLLRSGVASCTPTLSFPPAAGEPWRRWWSRKLGEAWIPKSPCGGNCSWTETPTLNCYLIWKYSLAVF